MSSLGRLVSRFEKLGLKEIIRIENAKWRKLTPKHSAAAATAQDFEFEIKGKKLLHAIRISIGESTTAAGETEQGTLADDITYVKLEGAVGVLKYMTGTMNKALGIKTGDGIALSTGFYEIRFTDPYIKEAMPLPEWIFEPLILTLTGNAPAASNYHHVRVSVQESFVPKGLDISSWRILYEKYLKDANFGTDTGWMEYDHSTIRNLYGLLYEMDDDGTLSNTEFDRLKLKGEKPEGEHIPVDEQWVTHLREENLREMGVAMPTGFMYLDFPDGYDSGQYKSFQSTLNIPTAATNAGLRVLERYLQ